MLDRVYELFIGSSPEVAATFANTDFRVQESTLKVLYMVMASIERKPESNVHLERIAAWNIGQSEPVLRERL